MSETGQAGQAGESSGEISVEDFQKVDVRVGRILSAQPLDGARKPAYKLRIDFGPELGVKQSSAQITVHYTAEALVGRLVLAVVNFPPRRIAGFRSEVLTLGVPDAEGAVVLITPTLDTPLGGRLF
ncbi:MAG TPA: tRNA-binding protein [Ktedonobacterales bacterium]|nr:tRNA-binding protein [Ktedonobacterales bacterium]